MIQYLYIAMVTTIDLVNIHHHGGDGLVAKSCPTLCNPLDCSLPGNPLHYSCLGNPMGRGLPFLSLEIKPRDQTQVSCIGRQILYL